MNLGTVMGFLWVQQREEERRHLQLLASLSRPARSVYRGTVEPSDPGARHERLGLNYFERGQFGVALQQFERAIDDGVSPESWVWALRVDCLARLGRIPEAEAASTEWVDVQHCRESLQQRAALRLQLDRYAEALADADAAVELDPGSSLVGAACPFSEAEICRIRAWSLVGLGRSSEAINVLKAAIDRWPTDVTLYTDAAELLSLQHLTDEAASSLRAARRLAPETAAVERAAARVASRSDDWAGVITAGHALQRLAPTSAEGWAWSGLGYRHERRFVEAASDLERALELMPNATDAHFEYACALTQLGRTAEAAASLRVAVKNKRYRALAREDPDLRERPMEPTTLAPAPVSAPGPSPADMEVDPYVPSAAERREAKWLVKRQHAEELRERGPGTSPGQLKSEKRRRR